MGINAVLGSYLENSPQVSCWDAASPYSGCPQTSAAHGKWGEFTVQGVLKSQPCVLP